MIEGVTTSLLASAVWKAGKKGVGKFLKKKFGKKLSDEEYTTISEKINEIPIDKKSSKEEIEELIKDNEIIMKIIKGNSGTIVGKVDGNLNQTNNYDSTTNINGDNNRVAGRDYVENQTNIGTQNNITNEGTQVNNLFQNKEDKTKKY